MKGRPIIIALVRLIAATSLLLAAPLSPAAAMEISGAGATFPYPLYAKWAEAYKKETGTTVNYHPIGSGGGIKQIQNNVVTFGASDMPLKLDLLNKDGLVQFPTVIGGVVPVVNVEGVRSSELKLDGATLAKIFLGDIRTWDDPAIAKLDPDTKLPPLPILVVRRLDGSGTTFLWADYLSKVSGDWKSKVGSNTSVEWPTGIRANGNEGIAVAVQNTKGAIGYVEYAYAKQSKLATISLINKDGKTVEPRAAAFQAAAVNAKWDKDDGFQVILTDEPARLRGRSPARLSSLFTSSRRMQPRPAKRCGSLPGPIPKAAKLSRISTTCRYRRMSSLKSRTSGRLKSRTRTESRSLAWHTKAGAHRSADGNGWRQRHPVFCHQRPQPIGIIGDDTVDTECDKRLHLGAVIDGPRDDAQPQRLGLRKALGREIVKPRRPDRALCSADQARDGAVIRVNVESGRPRRNPSAMKGIGTTPIDGEAHPLDFRLDPPHGEERAPIEGLNAHPRDEIGFAHRRGQCGGERIGIGRICVGVRGKLGLDVEADVIRIGAAHEFE